jgi:hypothetical protein
VLSTVEASLPGTTLQALLTVDGSRSLVDSEKRTIGTFIEIEVLKEILEVGQPQLAHSHQLTDNC